MNDENMEEWKESAKRILHWVRTEKRSQQKQIEAISYIHIFLLEANAADLENLEILLGLLGFEKSVFLLN